MYSTYNVTIGGLRVPFVTVEHKNASCGFSTLSQKELYFLREKETIEYKMCLLNFSTTFVRNISHSVTNAERYYLKLTQVSILSTVIPRLTSDPANEFFG